MITAAEYASKLQELANLKYTERDVNPEKEPVFNVYLNTRQIEVPSHFRYLASKGEHKAETIWFALDRYFDGQDLAQPEKKWAVQFVNALGEEGLHPIDYQYINTGTEGQDSDFYPENMDSTIKLGWEIHYDITKAAGKVTLSLRCFTLDGNDLVYNLATEPATMYIRDGLMISDVDNDYLMNPPKDNLSELVSTINELYKNHTITDLDYGKINEATLPTIDGKVVKGNLSSADFVNIEYSNIKNTPIYRINGEELEPGGNLELLTEADAVLNTTSTNPIQNKPVAEKFTKMDTDLVAINKAIAAINEELGNMTYIPLKITSFTNNLNLLEKGTSYSGDCIFTWAIDGNLKELKLVNTTTNSTIVIDNPSITGEKSITFNNLQDSVVYNLIATDPKGNTSSESTNIDFVYKLFYGAAAAPELYNEDFIKSLENNQLAPSKGIEFTVNAGKSEYIYFCLPESYGTPKFSVGGFEGGFTLVETVDYINNITTRYNIWKSDNTNLGDTTIKVV